MRTVLILDTETTGLGPDAAVIEVGAILYSVEHATVLRAFSSLIRADSNAAEAVNRIPAAALVDALDPAAVWSEVSVMALHWKVEAILAHNAAFDRSFTPPDSALLDFSWICTKSDLTWPKQTRPESSLVPLALDHDLGVAVAHRALADCDLIARLLMRCAELGHDVAAMLARGLRPKVTLMACVSYDDREKAKAAGFRWDAPTKRWLRRMVEEDADFDFPTRVVEGEAA